MEWKLVLWRPQKRLALNPTCRPERSLHNPSLERKFWERRTSKRRLRKPEDSLDGWGEDDLNQKFKQKSQKSTLLIGTPNPRLLNIKRRARVAERTRFFQGILRSKYMRTERSAHDSSATSYSNTSPQSMRSLRQALSDTFSCHYAQELLHATSTLVLDQFCHGSACARHNAKPPTDKTFPNVDMLHTWSLQVDATMTTAH